MLLLKYILPFVVVMYKKTAKSMQWQQLFTCKKSRNDAHARRYHAPFLFTLQAHISYRELMPALQMMISTARYFYYFASGRIDSACKMRDIESWGRAHGRSTRDAAPSHFTMPPCAANIARHDGHTGGAADNARGRCKQ